MPLVPSASLLTFPNALMPVQVKSESKKVWKFIIEREIEAPARFQAIQTHRAVMAILQQQVPLLTCYFHHGAHSFQVASWLFQRSSLQITGRFQGTGFSRPISHLP